MGNHEKRYSASSRIQLLLIGICNTMSALLLSAYDTFLFTTSPKAKIWKIISYVGHSIVRLRLTYAYHW